MYLQYYTEKKIVPHLCSTVLSTHLSRSGDSPDTAVQVYTVPLDCTGMTEIVTGRLTLYPSGGSAAILVFEVLQNGTLEAIKHLHIIYQVDRDTQISVRLYSQRPRSDES